MVMRKLPSTIVRPPSSFTRACRSSGLFKALEAELATNQRKYGKQGNPQSVFFFFKNTITEL